MRRIVIATRRGKIEIKTSNNELLNYIENTLESDYIKKVIFKEKGSSSVTLYQNNNNGKYIIKRVSDNLNDDVFRTLKGYRHKFFVEIYEVCTDEHSITVLEEYVEGKTLAEILENGTLDKKTACTYIAQLCDALSFLHSIGIIHRDIKPSNVVIRNDNSAVLIDFSIARFINMNEKDTQALGTPGYAAPEQFGITQSRSSTDIYGLGVLLNMMLTGAHPSVSLPKGPIKRVIQKSTATNISKRYRSAGTFRKAIQRIVNLN